MAHKDVREIIRRVEAADGWRVVRSGTNHFLIYNPDGCFVMRIPSTPGGRSFYRRAIRTLERNGFPW